MANGSSIGTSSGSVGPVEVAVVRTVDVPPIPTEAPPVAARANATNKRVFIRNIGPTQLLVALTNEPLNTTTPSDVFTILTNQEVVVPISPTQTVYLGSIGAGGRASVIVSPAIPFEWMGA